MRYKRAATTYTGHRLFTSLQPVQIIGPGLHHHSTFLQMSRAFVSPPEEIMHYMGQLMFDVVGSKAQDFIQNRSRHGPETMHRHLIRLDVHASKPRVGRQAPKHENGFRDHIDTG